MYDRSKPELLDVEAARAPILAVHQDGSIPATQAVPWRIMTGQANDGRDGTELARIFSSMRDHALVTPVQDPFEPCAPATPLSRLDVGQRRSAGAELTYRMHKPHKRRVAAVATSPHVSERALSSAATEQTEAPVAPSGGPQCSATMMRALTEGDLATPKAFRWLCELP